jgi:hypothetical protein
VLWYVAIRVLPAIRDAEGDLNSAHTPLRRLMNRIQLDPSQLEKASEGINDSNETMLADNGIATINTEITERLT